MIKNLALVISCEHAVNTIPDLYQSLFLPYKSLLDSHCGFDVGALEIALYFKEKLSCSLIQAPTSRLLIDYNRTIKNSCFSKISNKLPEVEKQKIITQYYLPYRQMVIQNIEKHLTHKQQVLHCSIHSFISVLNNHVRNAEIGLLYDPKRFFEKKLANEWKLELKKQKPEYRVRMNYPYKGITDGLTTSMRKRYSCHDYLGIEIEINQNLIKNNCSIHALKNALTASLLKVIRLNLLK